MLRRVLSLVLAVDALVARGPARSSDPLLSIPIPGSSSARFEVPSLEAQRKLFDDIVGDVKTVSPLAAVSRAAKANRAIAKIGASVLRDPSSASAPRVTRELFEELGATFVKRAPV